jgi:hypothetical protein
LLHDFFTLIDIHRRFASDTVNCRTSAREKADHLTLGEVGNVIVLRPLPKGGKLMKHFIQLPDDAIVWLHLFSPPSNVLFSGRLFGTPLEEIVINNLFRSFS